MKCPVVKWILKKPFYHRANFTCNDTDPSYFWGPVHSKILDFRHSNRRFIKGCIILYLVRIFSSSELVESHITPLKVRLALALKEEAEWQVIVRDCEHWILLLYGILILYWAYTCSCRRLMTLILSCLFGQKDIRPAVHRKARESKTALHSGFHALDPGYQALDSSWIPWARFRIP